MQPSLKTLLDAEIARQTPAAWPVAVDFETYYCTRKGARERRRKTGQEASVCTISDTGNWEYCRHPDWEAYLVSIWAPDVQYAGDPVKAPWEKLVGRVWLAHNRNFDRHVFERLVEQKKVPAAAWSEWHDTADLAVFSGLPRALGNAMPEAFGIKLDKGARASMDGVRWSEVAAGDAQRMLDYALEDAAAAWLLWTRYAPKWPREEQLVSLHTGEIEFRGIPVDVPGIAKDLEVLRTAEWQAKQRIPWFGSLDEDGKPVALQSKAALDRECAKCGVPAPRTTAAKSEEFLEWLDEYGDKMSAITDLARYRRICRAIAVYEVLQSRTRPDGRASLGLKYMGAEKTGRWSGTSKFNLQNLMKSALGFDGQGNWVDNPKDAVHRVDVRSRIVASPGKVLVIADLAQIEPRVLNWVVGNREFLNLCAGGMGPYEAHARASMGWTGGSLKKENPGLYALAKARVLALGYGAGWAKFITMARGYLGSEEQFLAIFGVEPSAEQELRFLSYLQFLVDKMGHEGSKVCLAEWDKLERQEKNIQVNAYIQVADFRSTNPLIKALWDRLDSDLKCPASLRDHFWENELPSGRSLRYFDVSPAKGWTTRPGTPFAMPQRTHGPLLTENMIQAIARDCFVHSILNLEQAGHRVLFHVHDEVIVEVEPGTDPQEIVRLMTKMPAWAGRLPVAAEAEVSTHYKK